MRVGVYIDGFNLYYGGRGLCGRGTSGWRWLDIRKLAELICSRSTIWEQPVVERVVYCTAPIKGSSDARKDQSTYIHALENFHSVDVVEYGNFVERLNSGPLAIEGPKGRPRLVHPSQLQLFGDTPGIKVTTDNVMVSYSKREEKGSDVNVASHLLVDLFEHRVDAALVVSNDSDLEFAVRTARTKISIGVVNPTKSRLVGKLESAKDFGAGRHFSMQLTKQHFTGNQLPDPVGSFRKPVEW